MNLNLLEITNAVTNAMSIRQDDLPNIALTKSYINEAYLLLCNEDKRVTKAYLPIINGIATIPSNSLGVVTCTPSLNYSDRIYGNSIVTNKSGVLEVLYYYAREILVEDTDEFDLNSVLQQAIINYACYMICNQRGETTQGESYYNSYMRNVSQFESVDVALPEYVMEVEY